jgi:hypothetical protein
MIIRPNKNFSEGARNLKQALTARNVKCFITQKAPANPRSMIVNWGGVPAYDQGRYPNVLNRDCRSLTNKLDFFNHVGHTEDTIEWTTDPAVASRWRKVVCRTVLNGSEGKGIIIWRNGEGDLPRAPLYTKYHKKTHEYRVHVFHRNGAYRTHVQRKVFVKGKDGLLEPKNWDVRSHDNGFIFQTENDNVPGPVIANPVRVASGFVALDFCAWDVLYNEETKIARVIEGNTAPGLEGQTVNVYADYFAERAR